MPPVKITYYLEILSSWCHYAEPVWSDLQGRYAGQVKFDWEIALMNPEDFPVSAAQCDWFYRRSGLVAQQSQILNSGWFQAERKADYTAANLVAEAGRDFGLTDDRLRHTLSIAGLLDGRQIGDMSTAVSIAARKYQLDASKLSVAARSKTVRQRIAASTAEFQAHQINQRPAFVLTDVIGDKAVFSGLVRIEPMAAAIDAMLADCEGYTSFAAHFGPIPTK